MDNISKALLMAAGILIAIMLVSLLIFAWNQMSGYYSEQHNSKIVEQIAEFNTKFENYNGQTIRGNELISIMNMIIDYNNSDSDMEGYDRIVIEVNLKGYQNGTSFKYDSADTSIFPSTFRAGIIHNKNGDTDIQAISNLPITLESNSGINDAKLQKLSAEISNIVGDDVDNAKRMKKIKNILGYEPNSLQLENIQNVTKQYYQYTQFKRAMFHCTTVDHNAVNGRVNKMEFEVEVENGNVKFK